MITNIKTDKLSKIYKGSKTPALDSLTIEVGEGEVYGFLGANGAGKSTTIRTLLNFLQPTSGSATICGLDIVKDNVKIMHDVGYLAGDVALYEKMTGKEFFGYMADLHPLPDPAYLTKLVHVFEAELHKPIRSLSKGNKQKIGIIQALMHQPKVLILDEPTSGLDPLMQEAFFETIREAKARGASVFFSSHNLAEVQRICDRVGFIRKGKLIREQSLSELASSASHTFDLVFDGAAPTAELKKIKNVQVTKGVRPEHVTAAVPAEEFAQFFAVLAKHKVTQFDQREVNLEEEFLSYYQEKSE